MKRLSSRSTVIPNTFISPSCYLRSYATTGSKVKPELEWKVDIGSSSSSFPSTSSSPPEPYYDEEVNVFWPVTPLDPPSASLSFLNSPRRPSTTHLFDDHGLPFRDPLPTSFEFDPLWTGRQPLKYGDEQPFSRKVSAREKKALARRERVQGERTKSWNEPSPENDSSYVRSRRVISREDDTLRSPPTFFDETPSEAVLSARRSAALSSSSSPSSSNARPTSDASLSQSSSTPTRFERPSATILRPTITLSPIYNPPAQHVRPDRTASSRSEPTPSTSTTPNTTTSSPIEPSTPTTLDSSSETSNPTATETTSRLSLPRSVSGSNPFAAMPLPDSSQPTGPYLAPLASALGQKEVPKACEKKASFLSWEAKPSDGGERVSAGQRTLDTLTKAVKYLDPHTALPSQSQYLRQASSKVWIAPKRLLKEDRALYFPNLAGHSLRDDLSEPIIHTTDVLKGRISLVSCSGSILNTEQTGSFSTPAWVAFKHDPDFSLVQVNIQSTSLKSLLVPYFVNNIRASVPKEQHSTYIISPSSVHDSAEGVALGMKHALAGYVYLVDENLKIRWAGSGFSTEEERKSLLVATQVLLHRFKTNVENEALARDRYPAHKLSGGIKQWLENKPKTFQPLSLEAPASEVEKGVPLIA